ncbi:MAG: ABC transporter permease, partial [Spirochaetales bacterium]
MTTKERPTLAGILRKPFHLVITANKRYGLEWWVLVAGAIIVLFVIYLSLFPQTIAPHDPLDQNAGPQLAAPSAEHLMGTDNLSRDVFSRMVFGSQTILGVAIFAALLSSLIGIPLGLVSGFVGGPFDRVLSLIIDSLYSFPGLILAIAFAAMLGPGVVNITLAVA